MYFFKPSMAKNTPKGNHFKKKTQREKGKRSLPSLNLKILKDRRFHLAIGFFLLISSVYLVTAFLAFLFTGKADQSVVEAINTTGMRSAGQEVDNWLGVFGAVASHFFIYKWFGIASFLIPPLLFVWGYHIVFRKRLMDNRRALSLVVFFSFWISILFGTLTLDNENPGAWSYLGGGIGFELSSLFHSLIGWGTFLLLILGLFVFMIFFFNITSILGLSLPFNDLVGKQGPLASEEEEPNPAETSQEGPEETEGTELAAVDESTEEEEEMQLMVKTPQPSEVEDTPLSDKVTSEEEDIFAPPTLELEVEIPSAAATEDITTTEEAPEPEEDNSWTITEEKKKSVTRQAAEEVSLEIETEPTTEVPEQPAFEVEPIEEEETSDELIARMGEYDPTLDLPHYQFPTVDLLKAYNNTSVSVSKEELEANKDKIVETLTNFKIGITSIKATIGPTVTLYEIVPEAGVKISKIKNLEDDIALSLAALGIRIIAPIPGKGTIGIEVPNKSREMVDIRSVLTNDKFSKDSKMALPIALGKTISNEVFVTDLAKMPHLLMAGATGQGKSVGLNVILTCLLYKCHPSELKFVLVDPKKVELTLFNKIERHFLAKLPGTEEAIITDTKKVIHTLNSLCIEMDTRYDLLKDAGCRNIKEYNKKFKERKLNPNQNHRYLPYIVLVIDELADLMVTAGKEIETPIARLAQLARAIGIHLVVATQRPSVNVITGIIKANFPARLSFRVTSKIDSRTILDAGGAEQLVGMGDMLLNMGSDSTRLQCAFVDTPEVEDICEFIGGQRGYPDAYLLPEFSGDDEESGVGEIDLSERDALFDDAARLIVLHQQGSTSLIQRKLKLGYNRAGRLIDQLEAAGIVGPFEGSKAREVLVSDEYALEQLLNDLNG